MYTYAYSLICTLYGAQGISLRICVDDWLGQGKPPIDRPKD